MLYYYKVNRRLGFRVRKWLIVLMPLAIAWSYLYSGHLSSVVSNPEDQSWLSFPESIHPEEEQTAPVKVKEKHAMENIDLNKVQEFKRELYESGKKKEAYELKFSLSLLEKIDKEDLLAKTRSNIIKQDIAKTVSYYQAGNTASSKAQILGQYGGGSLAYVYYPNYGVHFNPVTTANLAISKYAEKKYKDMIAITDELLENAIVRTYPGVGKYYIWENYFDLEFGSLKFEAPWASGMAQGLILDIIGKTYKITGDRKYLLAGELVLNSFRVPWNEGGVADSDEHGNWYLEVAATDKLRILNGFLFTLDSIYNFHTLTGNTKAKKLFDAGISELKVHLHEYDLGYWSNYSLLTGNRANYEYHKIHVTLLNKLYRITKISKFDDYAKKFDFYLKNRFIDIPPTHRSYKEISVLAEQGIILSTDGWFGAPSKVSRGQFISWLVPLLKWQPGTAYKGYYTDIGRDSKYWRYIEAAYENGVNLADADDLFRPNENLSRAEIASILCMAFKISGKGPPVPVTDISGVDQINHDIRLALSNGLMDTYESNYFRPDLEVTREQAAIILYKLLKLSPDTNNKSQ